MTDPDGNPKCKSKVWAPGWRSAGRTSDQMCALAHPVLRFQINYGGDIPKQYYVRDQVKQQYEHSVQISRGSSHQVEYEILFPGCVLR